MIESLRIENLGTISRAELALAPGFTVITGETGAGKTMLLTSLDWLLGDKPRASLVAARSSQAVVEGTFVVNPSAARIVEEAGGIVEDGVVEAARIVPAHSRSKAHLGGRTVPAATLGMFGAELVSVHGQTAQSRLRGEKAQREALDSFGGSKHRKAWLAYREAWLAWCEAKESLRQWEEDSEKRELRRELLQSLNKELQALSPQDGEFDQLTSTIARLSNVESLRTNVSTALNFLQNDSQIQSGAQELVSNAVRALEKASREDATLTQISETVTSAGYALADATRELEAYLEGLDINPEALQLALSRRAAYNDLSLKVAVEPDALGTAWHRIESELHSIQTGQDCHQQLVNALTAAQETLTGAANELHLQRVGTAKNLSKSINTELKGLDMAQTSIEITVNAREPNATGADSIQFMLRPYVKAPVLPLAQAASGGELSRIMLALEVTLAGSRDTGGNGSKGGEHTFIFDEVDVGIGGQAGLEVGKRLARLAKNHQVIVVTHLAQVAAFASRQIQVTKTKGESLISPLTPEQRREELARMISGSKLTDTALRHADELLEQASVAQS